ncbi:MAG: hypothetical protein GY940_31140, partial [bacterium]|nr:hypothetical protein [bacterium]
MLVDAKLNTSSIPSDLTCTGTRITLIRPAREVSQEAFYRTSRAALLRYCSYLRRNNRDTDPLPVYLSGKNITREMKLPGPIALQFKKGSVEGAIGLASKPRVYLYARGLPVWEGNTLEELSHTPPPPSTQSNFQEFGQGLAPVFLINGNHLEVNISRKKVIDNSNLQKVSQTVEEQLARMIRLAADHVSPRNPWQRTTDKIKEIRTSIFRSFTKTLLMLLIIFIPLEFILLVSFLNVSPKESPRDFLSLKVENSHYSGASVQNTNTPAAAAGSPLDLTYQPKVDTWFKLFTADRYQEDSGFLPGIGQEDVVPFPAVHCSRESISVELNLLETGKIYLPTPAATHFTID